MLYSILPWKSIKAVGFAGVRESNPQARHEGGMQDNRGALVPRGQVHRGHGPYTLTVQNDVLWSHSIPSEITE